MKLSANKILGHGGSKNEKRRMCSGVRKPWDKFANHSNSINPTPKCRASKSTFDSLNDDHGLILEIRSSSSVTTTVTPPKPTSTKGNQSSTSRIHARNPKQIIS